MDAREALLRRRERLDLILVLDAWSCGPVTPFLAERAGLRLSAPIRAAISTLRCAGHRETDVESRGPGIDRPGVWALAHCAPGRQVRMELMVLDEPIGLPTHVDVIRNPRFLGHRPRPAPAMTFQHPSEQQREHLRKAVNAALFLRAWTADAGLRERRSKRATPDTDPRNDCPRSLV